MHGKTFLCHNFSRLWNIFKIGLTQQSFHFSFLCLYVDDRVLIEILWNRAIGWLCQLTSSTIYCLIAWDNAIIFSIPSSTLTTMMWNLFCQNDHNEVSTKSSKPPWCSWLREFQLKLTFGIFLPSVLAVSHIHIYSSKLYMTNLGFNQSACAI